MKRLLLTCLALVCACQMIFAQSAAAQAPGPLQTVLQAHAKDVAKPSRKTIQPVIDAIVASGLEPVPGFLSAWADKSVWQRKEDGLFFIGEEVAKRTYALTDVDSGAVVAEVAKKELKQLKPNSGVRGLIATALVQFQLSDPNPETRAAALLAIERAPGAALLAPLRASIPAEADPVLLARKTRIERLLTIGYDEDTAARVAAIEEMSGDLGVDVRAALNPLVARKLNVATELPEGENIADILIPGEGDLTVEAAYDLLVAAEGVPPRTTPEMIKAVLADNINGGFVAGVPVAQFTDLQTRLSAYAKLAAAGQAPGLVNDAEVQSALDLHVFYETYAEPNAAVTTAAEAALSSISTRVGLNQSLDLGLDAISLASIYFLAAIGLAITFGLMGVINMAHGEFIMMGAYTGYVVQQVIPNHTASIIVAIPLAFAVTFAAGVAMERLVIRHLYNRPLETLLATFGISIALQQLAKNIFGTQARPLTAPGWLDGAWAINDVVSISYIRIAIFVLALIFLAVFLFIMNRSRLGLETRAVTQNPRMAAAMGINPERVNMLTFGLGSGIAGIAGVAIGLYAKVTSELGSDYIVQSFMTVVVGGVGNIWGALLGAGMIGTLQKGIEWLNPSNTLAAQTYMIIFIIIFIQFRPRGIIALKGRAAGD
ncbi:LIV-I protein H [Tritonibacter multivorans]|uniref:LIV-I protein H n=1 Tax=Tritonibacter multivorans TaxID=928856 RepID=A0A0P1G7U1_9RHOB|nr:urea ABC transporter permease subunit UrtB [Tritonibacter multivorans]MDA7422315.1 urea ABC transporter permease subunit UrtB [Tritonibacter multivorans]CUH77736.1 LIV-I protein H [Tritonibacter multivorans]SFD13009.1 amino acid/amide ABC transporter membrane protein 1, HAAT family [Tritonibacter multivorans]